MSTSKSQAVPPQPSALPGSIIEAILQRLPQQQRLTSCALVCQAWAQAAACASAHIHRELKCPSSMPAWLAQHGEHLSSLRLVSHVSSPLPLPCAKLAQLQTLSASGAHLQLLTTDDAAGSPTADGSGSCPAACLPALQQLELVHCSMDRPEDLGQLGWPAGLTSVAITDLQFTALGRTNSFLEDSATRRRRSAAFHNMLQQLPGLQQLRLQGMSLGADAVQHVTAMSDLQDLRITLGACSYAEAGPSTLPTALTALEVNMRWDAHADDPQPDFLSALPRLNRLQVLVLNGCAFNAADLAELPRLQHLELRRCRLQPFEVEDHEEFDTAGTAALLQALRGLTQLRHLALRLRWLDTETLPPPHFAALTASSQLTSLEVEAVDHLALPRGAAQHMFPDGMQLQDLRKLQLCTSVESDVSLHELWCLTQPDVERLVCACPSLQSLDLTHALCNGSASVPLVKLPASLDRLFVGGSGFDDMAASAVGRLTQVLWLHVSSAPRLTDLGLEWFTGLRNLNDLQVYGCFGLSDQITDGDVVLQSSVFAGPIWQQLDLLCDESPVCAPERLRRLRRRVAQLEQKVSLYKELAGVAASSSDGDDDDDDDFSGSESC